MKKYNRIIGIEDPDFSNISTSVQLNISFPCLSKTDVSEKQLH